MPSTRNRRQDVRRVETALDRAGYPGLDLNRPAPERGFFDSRLDGGIRDFQRRNELKVDGLLNPQGPTRQAINRVLRRAAAPRRPAPPLKGLSGEAFAANGRLVRHLMTTAQDGLVPDLMAEDFRFGEAGRAKTADFLSQMFAGDPDRAKSLRAKAQAQMEADEKSLLDKLILQARKADAENTEEDEPKDPTPDDPGQDDDPDDNPEEPDEPNEPDEPEKPKPDEEKCRGIEAEIANMEATISDWETQIQEAEQEISEAEREIEALEAENENLALLATGIGTLGRFAPGLYKLLPIAGSSSAKAKIEKNNNRIVELKDEIRKKRILLNTLREDLETLKETLADLKK